ncbi:POLRMT [Cordylochernes scorpioides]|uniref:DNA-directed RNA polymerase n=1 Tax=Cordylochernes scorpioides TaxID=51811 RepID=A0ABY6KFG8_9ARAC|nr:POLRMT [Cordylochernes scorpioides]
MVQAMIIMVGKSRRLLLLRQPPYFRVYRQKGPKKSLEIKPNPNLTKLYQFHNQTTLNFEAQMLPMVSPPIPWISSRYGGYLNTPVLILRQSHMSREQLKLLNEAPETQLAPTLDSLNILGLCPWIINQPILDLMLEIFKNNGDPELGIPPPVLNPNPTLTFTPFSSNNGFAEHKKSKHLEQNNYSLWCSALYLFSLANHYRDRVFWFPHNIDFRGRTYPIPPHLNHLVDRPQQGSHSRDTEELRLNTIPERLAWVEGLMPEILDSADRPLTGRRWWTQCEDPWQSLAVCREISQAVRSGHPPSYVCHLPVHQDGSCNGLQHYAALGRDRAGAREVNLAPNSVPGDIYSTVAEKVEEKRQKDLMSSCQSTKQIAKSLDGHLNRKTVKQPVMTVVYGVTLYGAKLQVRRKLKDIPEFRDNPKLLSQVSNYVARNTLTSLGSVFSSTQVIQAWLTQCAHAISKFIQQPVCWKTPLGLPVVQPYRCKSHRTVSASSLGSDQAMIIMKEFSVCFTNHTCSSQKPHVVKQKNAFPANFIHSLDAAHMNLTSLYCQRAGITFVSVHDCFWTHPGVDTEIMNRVIHVVKAMIIMQFDFALANVPEPRLICREQFIALHSQPILEDLSNYFYQQFSFNQIEDKSRLYVLKKSINELFIQVPPKGIKLLSELSAIDTALKDININSPSKMIIYSDSRAAIYILQSCFSSQEPFLKSIAKSVNRLPANSSVTVQWLPAHVGIPGNELADSLAKAGALGLPEARESTTQLDERDLLRTIKTQCLQEWKSNEI